MSTIYDNAGNAISEDNPLPIKEVTTGIAKPTDIQYQSKTNVISTSTSLGASATYTSNTFDSNANGEGYAKLRGVVSSDVAGTLNFEHSQDGSTWDRTRSIAVAAGAPQSFEETIFMQYVRLIYVNGATNQTTFRLNGYATFL
jgi:hypothetical protein